jgi:tRNA A-37 threonylcarbamoyl transferase component Bud32
MAMKIEFAEQVKILDYDNIEKDFFDRILGMHYNEYLITDESVLSDFSFCGDFTDDYEEEVVDIHNKDSSMKPLYEAWDEWVINKIYLTYGIKLEKTTIGLVELFEMIEKQSRIIN